MISATTQSQPIGEYDVKCYFLLKVPGFVDWPEDANNQSDVFTICILGDDPIEKILIEKIKESGLKIKNKSIVVKKINSAKEAESSNILFIAGSERYKINSIMKSIKNLPILTFGDTEGFSEKGVMINMYVDGSIKFNVNKKTAEESRIYISSKLLAYANNVIK